MKQNVFVVAALCLFFPAVVAAKTVIVNSATSGNAATRSAAAEGGVAGEGWTAVYRRPTFTFVPLDDLYIPIQTSPPSLVLSNDAAYLVFTEEAVRSVTRTAAVTYTPPAGTVYGRRPILFVTLCGLMANTGSGSGTCTMQYDLDGKFVSAYAQLQYKHFAVDWQTQLSVGQQAEDLAGLIKEFLDARPFPWDVVLLGYSRGGIFAHELTRHLVGHTKIDNLHTFLLDPTGSPVFSDIFPAYKHTSPNFPHYAFNYFDGASWVSPYPSYVTTDSDRPISGYDNRHLAAESHRTFPNDWIRDVLSGAFAHINSLNDVGSFPSDGPSGMEVVHVSLGGGVNFDGHMELNNGTVRVTGSLTVSGVPGSVYVDATVGADSVQISGAQGAAAGQLIISADQVYVSQSTPLANHVANLDSSGFSADVSISSVFDVGGGIDADSDGSVELTLSIGGESVSFNPGDPGGIFDGW